MRFFIGTFLLLLSGTSLANPACSAPPGQGQPMQDRSADTHNEEPDLSAIPAISDTDIRKSPALSRLASNGAQLYSLQPEHGLKTVFARNGNKFRVFYITTDNQAMIGGVMWEATGHNITRDQVSVIPGTIPTVELGKKPAANPSNPVNVATSQIAPDQANKYTGPMAAASFGLAGKETARRVYMIIDPLCPWSAGAMERLTSYIESGRLQLAIVPISINDYENNKASTPAALELLSVPKNEMLAQWQKIIKAGHALNNVPASNTAEALLGVNMAAAHNVSLEGTPIFIWKDGHGQDHKEVGLPDNIETFFQP